MKFLTYKKVGGMHHWRLGRLGGSFYVAKAAKKPIKARPDANAHVEAYYASIPVIDVADHGDTK